MRKISMVLGAVASVAMMSHAAYVGRLIVRQQWPWSTDIKVEFELSGVSEDSPVDLDIKVFNGDVEVPAAVLKDAISGERFGIDCGGVKTFYIDPLKAFGKSAATIPDFKVKVSLSDSVENINEVLYKVFNLETGECEDITRAQLLNGKYGSVETDFSKIGTGFNTTLNDVIIWTGVTNYPGTRTTKLVMRKIPAKNKSFLMGSPADEVGREKVDNDKGTESQVNVRFSNDYFVSVFEVTRRNTNAYSMLPPAITPERTRTFIPSKKFHIIRCAVVPAQKEHPVKT